MYIQFVEVVAEVRKLDFHEAKSFSGVSAYAGEGYRNSLMDNARDSRGRRQDDSRNGDQL